LLRDDDEMTVWWGTWVEWVVALNRLVREDVLNEETERGARGRLERLAEDWSEIQPDDEVRLLAGRLSTRYPLRAADALQLAAALVWCEGDAEDRGFVCLDDRMRLAAQGEGFAVLPEQSASEIEARESQGTG
jgi:uncharacterized protein